MGSREFIDSSLGELVVNFRTSGINGNENDLRIKAVMPNGDIYESTLGFMGLEYDDSQDPKEPNRGSFSDWIRIGKNKKCTLAVPADPEFLSRIGFSFSYILSPQQPELESY